MHLSDGGKARRVAFFTPLPPAKTGTADYASSLIAELGKIVALEVFESVPRRFRSEDFDAVVYQIGNNPFHADFYKFALKHPGVAVLHEVNLHDLVRGLTARSETAYLREVVYEIFGQEMESFSAGELIQSGHQPRSFTMTRRLLGGSPACIVHSRFAANEVRLLGFTGRIARIPHGCTVRQIDGARYRAQLGIGSDQPLIGVFGYQRPDKQAYECLSVFRELVNKSPQVRLIVAGEPHPEVQIRERVRTLGLEPYVIACGHQSLEDFDGCMAACDVVLNLKSTTFGETSGVMMRAFALGKTVVVSDHGANQELPEQVCAKIPVDALQHRVLLECLQWLLSDRGITEEIGGAAQKWAAGHCSWEQAAAKYAEFLFPSNDAPANAHESFNEFFHDPSALRNYLAGWTEPGSTGSQYLEDHMPRLVRTLQLTPRGGQNDSILEMGCYMQITPALEELLGYGEVRGCYLGTGGSDSRVVQNRQGGSFQCRIDLFNAEWDTFPYPNNYFQTVICCELLEHLQHDPMQMLREIHRILKPDGVLLLSTPNVVSTRAIYAVLRGDHPGFYHRYPRPILGPNLIPDPKHAREYTPTEIAHLLSDSGFVVLRIETGPYSARPFRHARQVREILARLKQSTDLRDDCIFALGRKAALPKDRYPAWLYDQ